MVHGFLFCLPRRAVQFSIAACWVLFWLMLVKGCGTCARLMSVGEQDGSGTDVWWQGVFPKLGGPWCRSGTTF